jgi:hypothetical protein
MRSLDYSVDLIFRHTVALGSTQPQYQESSWGKGWLVHKTENLTAICEPYGPSWPVAGLTLPFFFFVSSSPPGILCGAWSGISGADQTKPFI